MYAALRRWLLYGLNEPPDKNGREENSQPGLRDILCLHHTRRHGDYLGVILGDAKLYQRANREYDSGIFPLFLTSSSNPLYLSNRDAK